MRLAVLVQFIEIFEVQTLKLSRKDALKRQEYCSCGNIMKYEHCTRREIFERDFDDYVLSEYQIEIVKVLVCPACKLAGGYESRSVVLCLADANLNDDSYQESILEDNFYASHCPKDYISNEYKRIVLYSPTIKCHSAIPKTVSQLMNEAEAVLFASPRASLVLYRAVLEKIWSDRAVSISVDFCKKFKKRPLSIKWQELFKIILEKEPKDADLEEITTLVRIFGNHGAHDIEELKVETEEILTVRELTGHLIERFYVDEYKRRKAQEKLNSLQIKRSILEGEKTKDRE